MTVHLLESIAFWAAVLVITTGLLQVAIYIAQLAVAGAVLARKPASVKGSALWDHLAGVTPPIALIAPAYNEAATIVESVRSLLSLQYPSFEVIVVNDGSRDDTLAVLIEAFELAPATRSWEAAVGHKPVRGIYAGRREPRLLVVDKENGGKADALNAGINLSRAPFFCAVDADSLLEADALLRAVQPFVDEPTRMMAVGGTIRIANGCKVRSGRVVEVGLPRRLLPLLQTVEYLRAFLMARLAWSHVGALTVISGAFGIFRRSTAIEVGGYTHGTVGEDLEIIVKIHRCKIEQGEDYRIAFIPEPVCWTEAPESLRVLARQRIRWQRGALETFFAHRRMLFNPRYGRVGTLAFGNMLLVDVLGPVIEVLGYVLIPAFWALGALSTDYLLAFLAITFTFGVFVSVGSLILEEIEFRRFPRPRDLLVLTSAAVMENFGYRQLNNFWRIVGTWRFLRGTQGSWGTMTRTGFRKG
ncbi:MAG: glycosyltransferase [Alphaproteobacteria bacterium]